MTGYGSRFVSAGYHDLKPFIKVHNKMIIEWVTKLFPNEENITFICKKEDIDKHHVFQKLRKLSNKYKIHVIDDWQKLGPVYDILCCEDIIKLDDPIIINYCDFYMHWDYEHFKDTMFQNKFDGGIPCYTGFHPHLIPVKNLYASCKVDSCMNLIDIKEKYSHHVNRFKNYNSTGTYYFKSGSLAIKYYKEQLKLKLKTNNEYYCSLTYNLLVKDKLRVHVYDKINKFCQWGTPEDLESYMKNINNTRIIKSL
jgi:NDP-sugar pyrophosphorylase family protein